MDRHGLISLALEVSMRFAYGRSARSIVLTAALAAVALVPGTAGAAHAAGSCEVTYATSQWGEDGGVFEADVTVGNTGGHIYGWNLTFTFPGSQQLVDGWAAQWAQSGRLVVASVQAGSIPPGSSSTIGFVGTWRGANPPPTDFAVNGVPCGFRLLPGPTPSPRPEPTPSPSPRPSVLVSPADVYVREGGSALVHMRLSQKPSYGWVTVDSERVLGDPDLSFGPRLLFTADNWSTWQPLIVTAEQDADSADGGAAFLSRISQMPGSGIAVWTARELDDDVTKPSPTPTRSPSHSPAPTPSHSPAPSPTSSAASL